MQSVIWQADCSKSAVYVMLRGDVLTKEYFMGGDLIFDSYMVLFAE